MDGMNITDYVGPSRPLDEPEAIRLREVVKSSPGVRRFIVQSNFNGLSYPFNVYITNVPWPKDPLEDQARWLKEERGGTIPEDTRALFRNLQKRAHENNLSFLELCMSDLSANSDSTKEELNKTKKKLLADIAALGDLPNREPARTVNQSALVNAYEALAATHERLGEQKESIQATERAAQVAEEIQRKQPNDVASLMRAASTQSRLGRVYAFDSVKEYVKAYAANQHALQFLELLSSHQEALVVATESHDRHQ